jgi:hypothetical protein
MNKFSLWMYHHPVFFVVAVFMSITAVLLLAYNVVDSYNDRVCRDYGAWHHIDHDARGLIACRQLGTNDLFFLDTRTNMILVPVEDSCRTYEFRGSH